MINLTNKQIRLAKENQMLLGIMAVITFVFIAVFFYFIYWHPKITIEGKTGETYCKVTAQRTYETSSENIKDFARLAIIKQNSFDYLNYRERLVSASLLFAPSAQTLYLEKATQMAEQVRKGKVTIKAVMPNPTQIERTGVSLNGFRFWVVIVPVNVQYFQDINGKPYSIEKQVIKLEITQTDPSDKNPTGLEITSQNLL